MEQVNENNLLDKAVKALNSELGTLKSNQEDMKFKMESLESMAEAVRVPTVRMSASPPHAACSPFWRKRGRERELLRDPVVFAAFSFFTNCVPRVVGAWAVTTPPTSPHPHCCVLRTATSRSTCPKNWTKQPWITGSVGLATCKGRRGGGEGTGVSLSWGWGGGVG